jgi:glutamate--cysteine ligase
MRFLDVFLLHCLLSDSPLETPEEVACVARNQECVAARGREPGLRIGCGPEDIGLREWGERLVAECAPVAEALDAALGGRLYREAQDAQLAVIRDPARTPSARLLGDLGRHGNSYRDFVLAQSQSHRAALLAQPLAAAEEERLQRLAADSIAEQEAIEAADTLPFEEFRKQYLAVERLGV